jgi:bilirubin oxidase
MKKSIITLFLLAVSSLIHAQYNTLRIPEALYGTTFDLNIHESTKQLRTGNLTVTGAINNETFWGPTLIINKGDEVHLNVTNNLNESTTVHWHGMHLPAVMDGGPHQVIPAGALWNPYWTVKNQASTLWYHPHLHETTQAQMTKGVGGFIIVKDPQEAALALPRTYGVDDIVLALTSRSYTTANQFDSPPTSTRIYGDYMLTNGTPNAQISLPKQYVRLRILNAEIERGYNLGFSDNRSFYIIANDGGLLNAPVLISGTTPRVKLMVGERVEIMVNLGGDAVGSSLDLKAYNSGQTLGFPGGEPNSSGQFGSLLNNIDFSVLHINVAATTSNPITTVPTALATNTYWAATDANVTRAITVTGGQGATPFSLDNHTFVLNYIDKTVNLNDIEKWTVTNNAIFGHSFHVHDIEFKVVARNGSAAAVGTHESGWKDTFYVPRNESVTFVGKFDDFADADVTHPYMYHCHFGNHEDGGMMGQFIVTSSTMGINDINPSTDFSVYPNPANDKLYINLSDADTEIYYVTIVTVSGRVVMMLPEPKWQNGIDISSLSSGVYVIQIMDKKTKSLTVKKFIKK